MFLAPQTFLAMEIAVGEEKGSGSAVPGIPLEHWVPWKTAGSIQYGQWMGIHKEAGKELRIGCIKDVAEEDKVAQVLKHPLMKQVHEILT